ncbi:hypothetical protein [Burkholderia sp. PAMC 26561]|uniref:hypothetical protein n=1 Tax=Burkholderia sp. PAMC 26561 TaxID=1795043 RepID=UPI00084D3A48|nr:hypothetical protein [Burkholderia sp. PAMC 26561]
MSKVVDIRKFRVTRDERTHRPGECAHRHIKLDRHGGIVTCGNCGAALSAFWALEMLSEQYASALANIARLDQRLTQANDLIATLSAALDDRQTIQKSTLMSDVPTLD